MPETTQSDLVERLREFETTAPDHSGIRHSWWRNPDGPEAAAEIERLQATVAKVQRSALTITECQRQIYDHYQKASTINKEAVGTLDSERAANAMLTEENDRLRAHCEALEKAMAPFLDLGPQRGAWGVISKALDDFAPMTITVTKAQMLEALAAYRKEGGA